MKAWHFMAKNRRLGYDDNRLARKSQWLVHKGDLIMCESGLHASKKITDALKYAPGSIICRVELAGEMLHQDDKTVAERRKVLWWLDGERLLRKFACMCALDVIHLWDAPDVVKRYLKTQDESLMAAARDAAWEAAKDAAWAAARDAAWEAARAAAWEAARDTAWTAPWAAAKDAASAAAWDAARDAAMDAAKEKQEHRLIQMVWADHRKANH